MNIAPLIVTVKNDNNTYSNTLIYDYDFDDNIIINTIFNIMESGVSFEEAAKSVLYPIASSDSVCFDSLDIHKFEPVILKGKLGDIKRPVCTYTEIDHSNFVIVSLGECKTLYNTASSHFYCYEKDMWEAPTIYQTMQYNEGKNKVYEYRIDLSQDDFAINVYHSDFTWKDKKNIYDKPDHVITDDNIIDFISE